ncbi:MAG: enoyl-CoA hydratase-related protein [Gemmatimonadota bacterium]
MPSYDLGASPDAHACTRVGPLRALPAAPADDSLSSLTATVAMLSAQAGVRALLLDRATLRRAARLLQHHEAAPEPATGVLDPLPPPWRLHRRERRVDEAIGLLSALRSSPVPVVATTMGPEPLPAAAVALLGAADVVLATRDAEFDFADAFEHLAPAPAAAFLVPGRLSPGAFRHLLLTGRRLGAEQARSLGLVDEVIEPGHLDAHVEALGRRLGALSREAVSQMKRFCAELLEPAVEVRVRLARDHVLRAPAAHDAPQEVDWRSSRSR